jgi:hypothetical protein
MNKSLRDSSASKHDVTDDFGEQASDLDKLLGDLRRTAEASGLPEDDVHKIEEIDKRLLAIHDGILELLRSLSCSKPTVTTGGMLISSVIVRIKNWEDYRVETLNSNTVSFLCQPEERTFQVDSLKDGRVYTFSGKIPSDATLLATWLSKELKVEQRKVLEGVLALG